MGLLKSGLEQHWQFYTRTNVERWYVDWGTLPIRVYMLPRPHSGLPSHALLPKNLYGGLSFLLILNA